MCVLFCFVFLSGKRRASGCEPYTCIYTGSEVSEAETQTMVYGLTIRAGGQCVDAYLSSYIVLEH